MRYVRTAVASGSVFCVNCPGCGNRSTLRAMKRGGFRFAEACAHVVRAEKLADGTVTVAFEAKPLPRD